MKVLRLTILILAGLACFMPLTSAMPTFRLPPNKTLAIPDGMKVHFGDTWVSTTGTAIHIQHFFESNWFNYTVDNAGTQNIYNETQPDLVVIDGVERPITNGWNYGANTITVTGATVQCFIEWIVSIPSPPDSYEPPSPQSSNPQNVWFKVTVGKNPAVGAEITVYDTAYNQFQGRYITEENGQVLANLQPGGYDWECKYRGTRLTGSFFHVEAETVKIDFATGQSSVTPVLDRTQILKIGIGAAVAVGAVFAIVTVTKNKRLLK